MAVPYARWIDFTHAGMKPSGKPKIDGQGRLPEAQGGRPITSSKAKQLRARARRAQKIESEALNQLYKPVHLWDKEELARGRPRNAAGNFTGPKPGYITRAMHEEIAELFVSMVKGEMNLSTVTALGVLEDVLTNTDEDIKGKPVVAASTKLDAAKFLLEHVVGKPKQRIEQDISVKLQGLLGTVMVNPAIDGGTPQLTQGYSGMDLIEDADIVGYDDSEDSEDDDD